MANSAQIRIDFDVSAFERRLARLSDDAVVMKIARAAMARAVRPLVAKAKGIVRRQSGLLARAIGQVIKVYRSSGKIVGVVGVNAGVEGAYKGKRRVPNFYAHLVEYGTRRHTIGEGSKLEQRTTRKGKRVVNGPGPQHGREHPGAKAYPFLRPALDATRGEVMDIFAAEIDAGLKREMV